MPFQLLFSTQELVIDAIFGTNNSCSACLKYRLSNMNINCYPGMGLSAIQTKTDETGVCATFSTVSMDLTRYLILLLPDS